MPHGILSNFSLSETSNPILLLLKSVRKWTLPKFVSMQEAGFRTVQIVCPFSLSSFDIFPQSLLATVALLTNKSHTDTTVSHQNNNDFPFQYFLKQLFKYVRHYTWDERKCIAEKCIRGFWNVQQSNTCMCGMDYTSIIFQMSWWWLQFRVFSSR